MLFVPSFLVTWASVRINVWRRNVIFTSQKLKTDDFRNSFGIDGQLVHVNSHCVHIPLSLLEVDLDVLLLLLLAQSLLS